MLMDQPLHQHLGDARAGAEPWAPAAQPAPAPACSLIPSHGSQLPSKCSPLPICEVSPPLNQGWVLANQELRCPRSPSRSRWWMWLCRNREQRHTPPAAAGLPVGLWSNKSPRLQEKGSAGVEDSAVQVASPHKCFGRGGVRGGRGGMRCGAAGPDPGARIDEGD